MNKRSKVLWDKLKRSEKVLALSFSIPLLAILAFLTGLSIGVEKFWWVAPTIEVKSFLFGGALTWVLATGIIMVYLELKTNKVKTLSRR